MYKYKAIEITKELSRVSIRQSPGRWVQKALSRGKIAFLYTSWE